MTINTEEERLRSRNAKLRTALRRIQAHTVEHETHAIATEALRAE